MAKSWRYDLVPDGGFEEHGHAPGVAGTGYHCRLEIPQDAQLLSINFSTKGVSMYMLTEGIEGADADVRDFFVCGNDMELPDGVEAFHHKGTAKWPGMGTAHVFETTNLHVADASEGGASSEAS